jgi:superfamily II DNA or RNA helicase
MPGGVRLALSRHLKVTGLPEPLLSELIQTFTLTNPRWLENERMGRWNRNTPKTLRYYEKVGGTGLILPRGATRRIMERLRAEGIGYTLRDRRRELPPVEMAFTGLLKPFQQTASHRMLAKEFGTLCAPTGSGKTVIGLFMIAQRRQPTVIMVHTRELAEQWMRQISAFLGMPEAEIGFIGAGKHRIGGKITVAMVQSLYKCAEAVSEGCGHIVVDECHRAPSRTFTEALSAFDARYMLGLSATPWRRDRLGKLIFWYLGDVRHEVASSALVAAGDVLEADIVYRETEFQPFHDPVREYSRMLAELTADDRRNRLIAADVALEAGKAQGTCLVLTDRKAHAETLNSLLHFKHHVASALLTGDLGAGERREVLERLTDGDIAVLVATGQLIGEGFDCPDLSILFLTTPVRFSGRLLQYLGRVLRPAPGKRRARVYDYVDGRVEVLAAAARARQRVYEGRSAGGSGA